MRTYNEEGFRAMTDSDRVLDKAAEYRAVGKAFAPVTVSKPPGGVRSVQCAPNTFFSNTVVCFAGSWRIFASSMAR